MTAEVIEFHRPKRPVAALKVTEQRSPPKLTAAMLRSEWKAALAPFWANPKNWRRSKLGNAYIVLNDMCVVINRDELGFRWEIRWRDGSREPIVSRWVFTGEQYAINDAFDAVITVG